MFGSSKVALAAVGVALATAVSACGGSSGDGSSGGAATAASGGSRTVTAPSGPVTIKVWDWGSPAKTALDPIIAGFHREHPTITVKHIVQPFDTYFTQLRSAQAARKGPDVAINYATPALFDFYSSLKPLDGYVDDSMRKELFGFGNVSSGMQEDGVPYGVPFSGQGYAFYYNKADFKKAGITAPPKTWDEFLAACEKLKAAGITPISAGFKDGYYAEWFLDSFSLQLLPDDKLAAYRANPDYSNPAFGTSLDLMKQLIDKGYMTKSAEGTPLFPDAVNNFASHKAAMFLGLLSSNANFSEFKPKLGNDLGVFLPPTVPNAVSQTQKLLYYPGLAWSISKNTKNADASWLFIKYVTSAANQAKLFEGSGTLPNSVSNVPTSDYPPAAQILKWVASPDKAIGVFSNVRPSVEAVFDKAIPEFVTGRTKAADVQSQLKAAQDKVPPVPSK